LGNTYLLTTTGFDFYKNYYIVQIVLFAVTIYTVSDLTLPN